MSDFLALGDRHETDFIKAIQESLTKAYEVANDVQKARLEHILKIYNNAEDLFNH